MGQLAWVALLGKMSTAATSDRSTPLAMPRTRMEASRKTLVSVVSSSTAPKVTMRKAIAYSLAEYARFSALPSTMLLKVTAAAATLRMICAAQSNAS